MNYIIENDKIKVTISDRGAEVMSIQLKKDKTEYLWQGDPAYWTGRAPHMFPICGRLTDGKYTYRGETYEMILHGFLKVSTCSVLRQNKDSIAFVLKSSEELYKIYPFRFVYTVEFTLKEQTLEMRYTATNEGDNVMYFAFGGHPGFNIPLDGKGSFEDYYVEFAQRAMPRKLVMKACYMTDDTVPFVLEDGVKLPLDHSLFDDDAIFITDMADTVTLKSDTTDKKVTLYYPDMKYLGFWHKPQSDAPYMCIEPWMSVPAYSGKIDELPLKRDMKALATGESYSTFIDITVE